MTLEEFQKLVVETNANDWTKIVCWGGGAGPSYRESFSVWTKGSGEFSNIEIDSHAEIYSLKSNLDVSVACGITHNNDFVEKWANSFPDKHASSSFVDFFYRSQLVFRDVYVSVDGGRARIPLPDMKFKKGSHEVEGYTVPRMKHAFYRMLNGTLDYDRYFMATKIEVVDEPWMF